MPIEGEYEPSPWAKVAEQVARYESSGGTDGAELDGVPCVVLWTRGRRTGTVRKSPLIRVRDGGRYAVVASMGGAPKHPPWYLNLLADPHVTLQDGPDITDFRSEEHTSELQSLMRISYAGVCLKHTMTDTI